MSQYPPNNGQPPNWQGNQPQWPPQQPGPQQPYYPPQQYQYPYPYQQPPPQQPFYTYPENYQYPEPGMVPPQPPKSFSRTSITLTTFFVLALLLMGSVVTYLNRVGATQTGTWTTTHTFSGDSTTKTAIFTVATDWKLLYSCDGSVGGQAVTAYLGVTVNDSNAQPLDVAVNTTCAAGQTTTGSTYEYQGGAIYLSIVASGNWSLTVQEPK